MPGKGIANSGNLDVLLSFVDCGKVKIAVSIKEGDFTLQRLFDLTEIDLDHWQSMLNSEVQRLSCRNFVELNHLVVSRLDDGNNIRRDSDLLATHELNYIKQEIHLAPAILGFEMSFPSYEWIMMPLVLSMRQKYF